MNFSIQERIIAFIELGKLINAYLLAEKPINSIDLKIENAVQTAYHENEWFTPFFIKHALSAIASQLTHDNIKQWLSKYDLAFNAKTYPFNIAIISAGNIPLVAFHDFLSVIITGNNALVKLSSKDIILLPTLAELLVNIDPRFHHVFEFSDNKINESDALIATGSNLAAQLFDYKFEEKRKIIRKNRSSIGIITGKETQEELNLISDDMFLYFGLGCRNISKIFIPQAYDFSKLLTSINKYEFMPEHKKYYSNYLFQKNILHLNQTEFIDTGFSILRNSSELHSALGVTNYEYYASDQEINSYIAKNHDNLQCIVSNSPSRTNVQIGESQSPKLWDYSDGIDTIEFILNKNDI